MNGINYLTATGGGYRPPDFDFLDAARQSQKLQLGQQQLESYPQDRAWEQERQGMVRQKFQWMTEDRMNELAQQPIKDSAEALKYLLTVGPMITFEKYKESRDWLINKNKIPEFVLPEAQQFMEAGEKQGVPPEELFEKWKDVTLTSAEDKLKEKLGMARLESAEKLTGLKIEGAKEVAGLRADSAEKVANARIDSLEKQGALRYQTQKDMEDLRQQHRQELEQERTTGREGRDLTSKQKEARISLGQLYGMNEFSGYDETISEQAAMASQTASQLLAQNPTLSAQEAAAQAYRKTSGLYKLAQSVPKSKKPPVKRSRAETVVGVKNSIKGKVDALIIFKALIAEGWSVPDAKEIIEDAKPKPRKEPE